MRTLLVLALLLPFAAQADELPAFATGTWATGTWAAGIWGASTQVTVPNVVGAEDAAAADSLLEAEGLDLGAETQSCSAATEGEIIRQNPPAGTEVELGTLVDLVSSSGTPCTGRPPLSIGIKSRYGL